MAGKDRKMDLELKLAFDDAVRLHQSGDLEEAGIRYQQILFRKRDHAGATHFLGMIEWQRGNAKRALELVARSIELESANPHFRNNLGGMLRDGGRPAEALEHFTIACRLSPQLSQAVINKATTEKMLGHADKAAVSYQQALHMGLGSAALYRDLGECLCTLFRQEEALPWFEKALSLEPENAVTHNDLGAAYGEMKYPEKAIPYFEKAIAIVPGYTQAHINLGVVLSDSGRFDDAARAFETALRLEPRSASTCSNFGTLYERMHDLASSIAMHDRAIECAPGDPQMVFNRSVPKLAGGNYLEGWAEYEYRLQTPRFTARHVHKFKQPAWAGEPLAGKTVLVHAEQGFGDTFQFCRYASALSDMGASVLIGCHSSVRSLMASLRGVTAVVSGSDPVPPFDYQIPMGSLPHAMKVTVQQLEQTAKPYLHAPPDEIASWRKRLGDSVRPKVGIVWQGNRTPDPNRSCPVEQMVRIADADLDLIVLQKIKDQAIPAPPPGVVWRAYSEEIHSFGDTAALMTALDLIVTIDTSTAHLGGALGVPTWVVLPFSADFRWLQDRKDSPWYPSMRLFRQPTFGNWAAVFDQVLEALRPWRTAWAKSQK